MLLTPPSRPALVAALLSAAVAGASLPGFAAEITGKPAILDGDTIEIAGQAIKLFGVDAPERRQSCLAAGKPWRCGWEAEMALAFFVAGNWVTCLEKGRGDTIRVVAVCYAGGVGGPDLGRWLVSQGWALTEPAAGQDYAAEQGAARLARKGLWRGRFVAPWVWRRGGRLDAWPRQPP